MRAAHCQQSPSEHHRRAGPREAAAGDSTEDLAGEHYSCKGSQSLCCCGRGSDKVHEDLSRDLDH